MNIIKIFLASSSELKSDREQFEIFIGRKNNDWVKKGIHLELVVWENFLDAMSQSGLQSEYNKQIRDCDIFVMLFFTKVGKYTEEEFETAFGQFKETNKPFIFTYFKNDSISTGEINEDDVMSLLKFKKKLKSLGHYVTHFKSIEDLKFQFNNQLDKLAGSDFLKNIKDISEESKPPAKVITQTHSGTGDNIGGDKNINS
jgi:hypothetical protein